MRLKLHWQILLAIILAGITGWLAGETGTVFGVRLYPIFDFVGTLFINALKMLIVPLIASSIIVGVAGLGSSGNLGRIGGDAGIPPKALAIAATGGTAIQPEPPGQHTSLVWSSWPDG